MHVPAEAGRDGEGGDPGPRPGPLRVEEALLDRDSIAFDEFWRRVQPED